jgi:hypothetical protein
MSSGMGPLVVCLVALAGLDACSRPSESGAVAKLQWVEHADPVLDARTALSHGDNRLLGVNGVTLGVPVTDPAKQPSYIDQYGVRQIDGTSEAVESPRHAELLKEATEYALRYNTVIVTHGPP